jgi:hypothetical protein
MSFKSNLAFINTIYDAFDFSNYDASHAICLLIISFCKYTYHTLS